MPASSSGGVTGRSGPLEEAVGHGPAQLPQPAFLGRMFLRDSSWNGPKGRPPRERSGPARSCLVLCRESALTQNLHLDVTRLLNELLHKQCPIPKGGQGLRVGPCVVLLQLLGAGKGQADNEPLSVTPARSQTPGSAPRWPRSPGSCLPRSCARPSCHAPRPHRRP